MKKWIFIVLSMIIAFFTGIYIYTKTDIDSKIASLSEEKKQNVNNVILIFRS